MTTYRHTATAATVTLPGRRQTVSGVSLTGREDAATMAALGFTALPPAPPPEPSRDYRGVHAEELAKNTDVREAVAGVEQAIYDIAAAGVELSELTFQGVESAITQATAAAADDLARQLQLIQLGNQLQNRWNRVVYHVGTLREAHQLWEYLVTACAAYVE